MEEMDLLHDIKSNIEEKSENEKQYAHMICSPSELRLILGYFFFSDSCFSCERFEPTRILCSFLLWLLTYIVDLPAQS